jgi:hypothetical protein
MAKNGVPAATTKGKIRPIMTPDIAQRLVSEESTPVGDRLLVTIPRQFLPKEDSPRHVTAYPHKVVGEIMNRCRVS